MVRGMKMNTAKNRTIRFLSRTGLTSPLFLLLFLFSPFATSVAQQTFIITVAEKTAEHPYFGQGWSEGYVIDGVEGKSLTLVRGVTYTFQMENVSPIHPFYITTSEAGASVGTYENGVTGNFVTGNQTLTFTPPEDAPDVLYYQCQTHEYMGAQLNIVDSKQAALELVAEGLTAPVLLAEPPDGSGRLFIGDQTGQVYIVGPDGTRLEQPFLDISDRMVDLNESYDERGLLGLAFHPDYASNGRFFVYYSAPLREEAPDEFNHTSHVSEFMVSAEDSNRTDHESEQVLLQIDQPQGNHNGGSIAFGPHDDYLYIALGDGGGANDTGSGGNLLGHVSDWYDFNAGGNAQDVEQNLLGSILRIDVDSTSGDTLYAIPPDNPFGDEQYAYGFRNPYRFSFDMEPDSAGEYRLFVGDAGQAQWEEVSIVELGGNYGWNVKEGTHCFDASNPQAPLDECPDVVGAGHPDEGDPLIDPVVEFLNSNQEGGLGLVVVGGYVYRGSMVPDFENDYFFAAWSGGVDEQGNRLPGRIFVAEPASEGLWPFSELQIVNMPDSSLSQFVLSFGQDQDGEVYVLTTDEAGPTGNTGRVYRLISPVGVADESDPEIPVGFALDQNYPNPFNPTTTITYHLPQTAHVKLTLFDVLGREITTLVDGQMPAGSYSIDWDGTDNAGQSVPSGVYLYRLSTESSSTTKAMTLIR